MTYYTLRLLGAAITISACGTGAQARRPDDSATGEVAATQNLPRDLAAAIAGSAELRAAEDAIEAHHPWHATELLAPVMSDPARRTPAATLLAARAAAAWRGWTQVDALLGNAGWLDTAFDANGRELLACAALAQGHDSAALAQSRAALAHPSDAASRDVRLVYLARSYDRMNQPDSAAALYAKAAAAFPSIRDWLLLRAAGAQSDSAARAGDYARLATAVARARIPWTEAQARERFSDAAGAAARFAALGATVRALDLRLTVAPDSASRAALRAQLVAYVRAHAGSANARDAAAVLDRAFSKLDAAEELTIARSAARSGPAARAVSGFARATAAHLRLTAADRLAYAQSLAAAGHRDEALRQFTLVTGRLAGTAAYQRARLYLNAGDTGALRAALRAVVARFPHDTAAAPPSLYLLADLATDQGNDTLARDTFRRLASRYPTSSWADDARFRAAIIDLVLGRSGSAAAQFDSLVKRYPRGGEAMASTYWAGRAWADAGDSAAARTRWNEVLRKDPTSYYAVLAARRLDQHAWAPTARPDSGVHVAAVDNAIARAALLQDLGMDAEARFEYDALESAASASPARLLATAYAFRDAQEPVRSIRLANRIITGGERDARAYRLLFPVLDREQIQRAAAANHVDPGFIAGVIRQESSFNPNAVSVAGARGLMQVMPSVGAQLARDARYPLWDPVLLFDPDVNIQLGTTHLAAAIAEYKAPVRVLAAYNAGDTRVDRWSTKAGMSDPEIFAERIPFTETRDYVRIVQRNAVLYDALYGW